MLARSKSIARATCSGLRGLSTPSFDIKGTLRTDGLKVGNYAEVRHTFDQTTVTDFADICGRGCDYSALQISSTATLGPR